MEDTTPVAAVALSDEELALGEMGMISICIPCYRGADRLDSLLHSLALNNDLDLEDFEVIVYDDGSPDEDAAAIKKVTGLYTEKYESSPPFNVRHIRGEKNLGAVGALREAVSYAQGNMILQLDDDVLIPEDLLGTVEDLLSIPNIGALSWRSFGTKPGQSTMSAVGFLEPATEIAGYCLAYRKEVSDEVGGIDTRFKFYCSDSDFALRVALAGHPCYRVWWPLVPHAEHGSIDDVTRHQIAAMDLEAFRLKWGASGQEMERKALAKFRGEG